MLGRVGGGHTPEEEYLQKESSRGQDNPTESTGLLCVVPQCPCPLAQLTQTRAQHYLFNHCLFIYTLPGLEGTKGEMLALFLIPRAAPQLTWKASKFNGCWRNKWGKSKRWEARGWQQGILSSLLYAGSLAKRGQLRVSRTTPTLKKSTRDLRASRWAWRGTGCISQVHMAAGGLSDLPT